MTESADKVFTNSVRKQSRRGSSWVHPAPHTNDPHIVNRILSPRSKVRRELMSNYSRGEIVRSPGDAPTTSSSSPTSDFLIKGKATFSCPVRIYPVNGSFTRSDDDAGIVTVSHDKKKIYCPTKSMREVTSFEFEMYRIELRQTQSFSTRALHLAWILFGKVVGLQLFCAVVLNAAISWLKDSAT